MTERTHRSRQYLVFLPTTCPGARWAHGIFFVYFRAAPEVAPVVAILSNLGRASYLALGCMPASGVLCICFSFFRCKFGLESRILAGVLFPAVHPVSRPCAVSSIDGCPGGFRTTWAPAGPRISLSTILTTVQNNQCSRRKQLSRHAEWGKKPGDRLLRRLGIHVGAWW